MLISFLAISFGTSMAILVTPLANRIDGAVPAAVTHGLIFLFGVCTVLIWSIGTGPADATPGSCIAPAGAWV